MTKQWQTNRWWSKQNTDEKLSDLTARTYFINTWTKFHFSIANYACWRYCFSWNMNKSFQFRLFRKWITTSYFLQTNVLTICLCFIFYVELTNKFIDQNKIDAYLVKNAYSSFDARLKFIKCSYTLLLLYIVQF